MWILLCLSTLMYDLGIKPRPPSLCYKPLYSLRHFAGSLMGLLTKGQLLLLHWCCNTVGSPPSFPLYPSIALFSSRDGVCFFLCWTGIYSESIGSPQTAGNWFSHPLPSEAMLRIFLLHTFSSILWILMLILTRIKRHAFLHVIVLHSVTHFNFTSTWRCSCS